MRYLSAWGWRLWSVARWLARAAMLVLLLALDCAMETLFALPD